MSDIFTKKKRSEVMSRIKGKDTSIELKVRSYLHRKGYRFRVNDKRYSGTPDIVLPKYRTIIFVNGCFWHGHGCGNSKIPESNKVFWTEKIKNNKIRDDKNHSRLREEGWKVAVVWECEIEKDFEDTMNALIRLINA